MKTVPTALQATLESELATLATCWKLSLQNGSEYFFTDHDVDLVIDGDTYEAASGMMPKALDQNTKLSPDNMDVVAFLESAKISETDILAGDLDYATIDIFVVDYNNLNPIGGQTAYSTFGTESYSVFAQQTELVESVEFGHFDIGLIVSAWNADLPACTVTKLWARLRWQGTGGAPIKIGIYDASGSDAAQWAIEQVTPETLIASSPTSGWKSITVDWDLTAGEKALAIIAYNVPADTYGLRVFYDFANGTPDDGSVVRDVSQFLNNPLGDLGAASPKNYCLYAEYEYTSPVTERLWLAQGWVLGKVEISDQAFQVEIRGKAQHLDQQLVDHTTAECRAVLGDTRCTIDMDDSAGTYRYDTGAVTSQSSDRKTFIDTNAPASEDFFAGGLLTWNTPASGESFNGGNAGYQMEIKSYDIVTQEFVLFQPMPSDIEVGDEFTVKYGCNKSSTQCKARFSNLVNFRGEPFIPGWDATLHTGKA